MKENTVGSAFLSSSLSYAININKDDIKWLNMMSQGDVLLS